jgi:DNA-binding transcriptional MerR regulator
VTSTTGVGGFTIDELAERAEMTVRNVRAYASRGLIDPPRLVGRTGYYGDDHLQRLQLVRLLLRQGYTLAAVEDALLRTPSNAPGHALELLHLLEVPEDRDTSEIISRTELAALAGVPRDDDLMDALPSLGVAEVVDDEHFRVINPGLVRPGAAARALGLSSQSVIAVVPMLLEHMHTVAEELVGHATEDIFQPFLDAGLPIDDWEPIFARVQMLIPIASRVVLAAFRQELDEAIETSIGKKLTELGSSGPLPGP